MEFNVKEFTTKNKEIILVLIYAFILRLSLLKHCLWVDEARDMSIAYHLVHNGTLTLFNGKWWFQHPIMEYLILAPSAALSNTTLATLSISILSIISIYGVYIIGKELFDKKTGVLSAFIFGSIPIYLFMSTRILNDVTHTTFVILAFASIVLFYKRNKRVYSGLSLIFSIFAMTTRVTSGLLPLLMLGLIAYKERKKIINNKWVYIGILIGSIPGIIWLGLNYVNTGHLINFGIWEEHLKPGILDSEPWYYYIIQFPAIYTISLTAVFIIGLTMHAITKFKKTKILLIWFLFYFIIISMVSVKVPRYAIPTFAPFVLIGVSGFLMIGKIKGVPKGTKWVLIAVLVIIGIWLSYTGYNLVKYSSFGFCGLDYISHQIKGNTTYGGSFMEMSWYAKKNVNPLPRTQEEFTKDVKCGDLIEVDMWERTQPKYIFQYIVTHPNNFKTIAVWPTFGNTKYVYLFEYVCNQSVMQ